MVVPKDHDGNGNNDGKHRGKKSSEERRNMMAGIGIKELSGSPVVQCDGDSQRTDGRYAAKKHDAAQVIERAIPSIPIFCEEVEDKQAKEEREVSNRESKHHLSERALAECFLIVRLRLIIFTIVNLGRRVVAGRRRHANGTHDDDWL